MTKIPNSYKDEYVRSQIVKYVASLPTMSSGNRRLTALSQRVSLFRIGRFKTPKLGQLTYLTSLQDIMNIAKIHRFYSWDVRGWCSDKEEGILLNVDAFCKRVLSVTQILVTAPM